MGRHSVSINGTSYSVDFTTVITHRGVRWNRIDVCPSCALAQLGIFHTRILDEMTGGEVPNAMHHVRVIPVSTNQD